MTPPTIKKIGTDTTNNKVININTKKGSAGDGINPREYDVVSPRPTPNSNIKSGNDVQKAYPREQLVKDFYENKFVITSCGLPYAEYTIDSKGQLENVYLYDGNKVRKMAANDPLFQIIRAVLNEGGMKNVGVYNKEVFDVILTQIFHMRHAFLANYVTKIGSMDISNLPPNEEMQYRIAGLHAREYAAMLIGLYAPLLKSRNIIFNKENLLNKLNEISESTDIMTAYLKLKTVNEALSDVLKKAVSTTSAEMFYAEALFELYNEAGNYGPGIKKEYMSSVGLLVAGKLQYRSAAESEARKFAIAKEAQFSVDGEKVAGYLISSDKEQAKELIKGLEIGDEGAYRSIILGGGKMDSSMLNKEVQRDSYYRTAMGDIASGKTIKTKGENENRKILAITKEYVVLKELGLKYDDAVTAIESIDKRNNTITLKVDSTGNIDTASIRMKLDNNDQKIIVSMLQYLGYMDKKTKATQKDISSLIISYLSASGVLAYVMKKSATTLAVDIMINKTVMNALMNECVNKTDMYVDGDKKVYVRGKNEKVPVSIEGFTAGNLIAGNRSSKISIDHDGRDLVWENPTFVFKLYLHENCKTAAPIKGGVYQQVLTADEVQKFAEFKAAAEGENKTKTDISDITSLLYLADHIRSGQVIVTDIYSDVPMTAGKEVMCEKINEALGIIRKFYEYTVSRNVQLMEDKEKQEIAELGEQEIDSTVNKGKAYIKDVFGQLLKMPSSPISKTLDQAEDGTILSIKENMFTVKEVGADYLIDPKIDAKFIRAFVKQYEGLLNNSLVLRVMGMTKEKINDPKAYLMKVADIMEARKDKFSIHFERNVIKEEYQTAKVILQAAIQSYRPGVKKVDSYMAKEINAVSMLKDSILGGITAYPFALSIKGYLVGKNKIKVGSVSLNDEKIGSTVIDAAAKDFRDFIKVMKELPEKDALRYLKMTGLKLNKVDELEKYCKKLEGCNGKKIDEFDLNYNGNGTDKELINALKVYVRTVIPLRGAMEKDNSEAQMNIAIAAKKMIGWDNPSIMARTIDTVGNKDVLVTSQEVPNRVDKDMLDAAGDGTSQLINFKFLMGPQIQIQMQAGITVQTKRILSAMADGDPYAADDLADAYKQYAKTRISFLAFMANPYVWAQTIITQAAQGDPTAVAMLLVTGTFILAAAGNLIRIAGKIIDRTVYNTGGKPAMDSVYESSATFTHEEAIKQATDELKQAYVQARNEIISVNKNALIPKEMPEFSKELTVMGKKAELEYSLRSGAGKAVQVLRELPGGLLDPIGKTDSLSGGKIAKAEKAVARPFKWFFRKVLTKAGRGRIDPKYIVSAPTMQETIVNAVRNPNHDFTFVFRNNNWLVNKTSEPIKKAYEAVEGTRIGSRILGWMGIAMPDPGTESLTLKGWQIVRILVDMSGENAVEAIGLKVNHKYISLLLSNLSQSAEDILGREDVVEYLNRQLGFDLDPSDYDLRSESGLLKLSNDINARLNVIADAGEDIHKAEIKQFNEMYEYAAKNPLYEMSIDVGLGRYGSSFNLKITGEEFCTLFKLFNSPFLFDASMGFGPRNRAKYSELINNIIERNPWLKQFYLDDGIKSFELNIFNNCNGLINKAVMEQGISLEEAEARLKSQRPLEFLIYKKVKDASKYEQMTRAISDIVDNSSREWEEVEEDLKCTWSKEDVELYENKKAISAYYSVESEVYNERIKEITKDMVPSLKGYSGMGIGSEVEDLGFAIRVGDNLYCRDEVIDRLNQDPKALSVSYKKKVNGMDKGQKALYMKGLKLRQAGYMGSINDMVTGPLGRKFAEANPQSVLGRIFVANTQKHKADRKYHQAKANARDQRKIRERYLQKAKSDVAGDKDAGKPEGRRENGGIDSPAQRIALPEVIANNELRVVYEQYRNDPDNFFTRVLPNASDEVRQAFFGELLPRESDEVMIRLLGKYQGEYKKIMGEFLDNPSPTDNEVKVFINFCKATANSNDVGHKAFEGKMGKDETVIIGGYTVQSDDIGADLMYFDRNGQRFVISVDVEGHGKFSAHGAMAVKYQLDHLMAKGGDLSGSELFAKIDHFMGNVLHIYAYVSIQKVIGNSVYFTGGSPSGIMYYYDRNARSLRVIDIDAACTYGLGNKPKEEVLEIMPGDRLIMVSDGLFDIKGMSVPDGIVFFKNSAESILNKNPDISAEGLHRAIKFEYKVKGKVTTDDQTVWSLENNQSKAEKVSVLEDIKSVTYVEPTLEEIYDILGENDLKIAAKEGGVENIKDYDPSNKILGGLNAYATPKQLKIEKEVTSRLRLAVDNTVKNAPASKGPAAKVITTKPNGLQIEYEPGLAGMNNGSIKTDTAVPQTNISDAQLLKRFGEYPLSTDSAFEMLGLKKGASVNDINKSWKELSKTVHPDKGIKDPRFQQNLNRAKDISVDYAAKGKIYESGRAVDRAAMDRIKGAKWTIAIIEGTIVVFDMWGNRHLWKDKGEFIKAVGKDFIKNNASLAVFVAGDKGLELLGKEAGWALLQNSVGRFAVIGGIIGAGTGIYNNTDRLGSADHEKRVAGVCNIIDSAAAGAAGSIGFALGMKFGGAALASVLGATSSTGVGACVIVGGTVASLVVYGGYQGVKSYVYNGSVWQESNVAFDLESKGNDGESKQFVIGQNRIPDGWRKSLSDLSDSERARIESLLSDNRKLFEKKFKGAEIKFDSPYFISEGILNVIVSNIDNNPELKGKQISEVRVNLADGGTWETGSKGLKAQANPVYQIVFFHKNGGETVVRYTDKQKNIGTMERMVAPKVIKDAAKKARDEEALKAMSQKWGNVWIMPDGTRQVQTSCHTIMNKPRIEAMKVEQKYRPYINSIDSFTVTDMRIDTKGFKDGMADRSEHVMDVMKKLVALGYIKLGSDEWSVAFRAALKGTPAEFKDFMTNNPKFSAEDAIPFYNSYSVTKKVAGWISNENSDKIHALFVSGVKAFKEKNGSKDTNVIGPKDLAGINKAYGSSAANAKVKAGQERERNNAITAKRAKAEDLRLVSGRTNQTIEEIALDDFKNYWQSDNRAGTLSWHQDVKKNFEKIREAYVSMVISLNKGKRGERFTGKTSLLLPKDREIDAMVRRESGLVKGGQEESTVTKLINKASGLFGF